MRDDYGNIWSYRAKWAYLLMVVAALLLPSFYVIYISFNEYGYGARIYEFTFDWYRVVLGGTMLVASLKWTGYLALGTVGCAVPMALLAAKFYKRTRRKVLFVTLMLSPLFVPADIMGSSLLVYFKILNGVFKWLGEALGVDWLSGVAPGQEPEPVAWIIVVPHGSGERSTPILVEAQHTDVYLGKKILALFLGHLKTHATLLGRSGKVASVLDRGGRTVLSSG